MEATQSRDSTPDLYAGSGESRDQVQMEITTVPQPGLQSVDPDAMRKLPSGPDLIFSELNAMSTNGVLNDVPMRTDVQAKRKRSRDDTDQPSEVINNLGALVTEASEPEPKRLKGADVLIDLPKYKISHDTQRLHGLTVSLWQQVFTFVPPVPLARLLRVCRPFKIILDASSQGKVADRFIGTTVIDPAESDRIWKQSHKLFARGLPLPFAGQKEIDLWRLIKGNRCHHCSQTKNLATESGSISAFQSGPGKDCVRIVWPFQVRLCGDCLRAHSRTDDDLTLSGSFPSFLKDALPSVYLSEANDYVSASKYATFPPPPGLRMLKVYYRPQVEAIKRRYDHIKEFKPEQAAEWVQSLDEERLQIIQDAERWETWEQKGALLKLNSRQGPARGKRTATAVPLKFEAAPIAQNPQAVPTATQTMSPHGQSYPSLPWAPYQKPSSVQAPGLAGDLASPTGGQPRPPRHYMEIQAARAIRRAEIERRSMLLTPPISPKLLEHMRSFRAALLIPSMLDDAQWMFLKARLESERPEAEEKLAQHIAHEPQGVPEVPVIHTAEAVCEAAQEISATADNASPNDADEEVEEPKGEIHIDDIEIDPNASNLQKRLAHFADQVILGKWNGGKSLSKESCAQFAAEVLLQVRKNYYEEAFGGQHAIDPTLPRMLTLENMKWVHENRIKPLTEQFQKDVFLCNGCENNTKGYGFEAVIQHYAAKHTTSMSMGSVVVHWKAEWPEKPPFHPNPMLVKALAITSSTSTHLNALNNSDEISDAVLSLPQQVRHHEVQSPLTQQPPQMHAVNGGFTGHSAQNGYPGQMYTPQNGHGLPTPASQQYIDEPPAYLPPSAAPYVPNYSHNGAIPDQSSISSYQATPSGMAMPYAVPPPSDTSVPTAETYRKHLTEMAKFARELWFATAGVKGLPGTVRTQIIIHHACERFVSSFQLQPGVAMFLDGLNHEAAMRPLRSLNGFSCKACATGQMGALPHADRKQSTLPHLLGHFRAAHAEHPGLDWRKDMVQLPQMGAITDLVNATGMDDAKLALLAAAFPGVFPYPLPSLASLQRQPATSFVPNISRSNQAIPQGAYQAGAASSPAKMGENNGGYSGIYPPSMAERKSNSPGDDEYDPTRPSYVGHIVSNQHSNSYVQGNRDDSHRHSVNGSRTNADRVEADRFLDDLKPRLAGSHAEQSRGHYTARIDASTSQYQPSYPHERENAVARQRNGSTAAGQGHYYEPQGQPRQEYAREPQSERYVTRYYEPAPREEYAPVSQEQTVAYYIREPDGRLVPADDRSRIVYEREAPRERAYEYITNSQSERYYAPEVPSASYRDEGVSYAYQPETRVVYVDQHEQYAREAAGSYDPLHPADGYRQEQVYGAQDTYRR